MRALAAAAAILAASPALAFVRSTVPNGGPCLFWAKRTLPFVVNSAGTQSQPGCAAADSIQRVHDSFFTWTGPACTDLQFDDQGTTDRHDTGYVAGATNNINLILWRPDVCDDVVQSGDPCVQAGTCANKYNCWEHGNISIIAVTTTTFNRATGEIVDADMELNDWNQQSGFAATGFYFTCVDPLPDGGPGTCTAAGQPGCIDMDIQNTVTHEAGHFIGLDHTPDPNATMYANAEPGETKKRMLHDDDIQGLCSIYPAGGPTSTCVDALHVTGVGFDLSASGCGCGAGAGGLAALASLAALLRRRYRKRAPA